MASFALAREGADVKTAHLDDGFHLESDGATTARYLSTADGPGRAASARGSDPVQPRIGRLRRATRTFLSVLRKNGAEHLAGLTV